MCKRQLADTYPTAIALQTNAIAPVFLIYPHA